MGSREDFKEEETEMRGLPWRMGGQSWGKHSARGEPVHSTSTEGYSSNRQKHYGEKWTRDFQEWKAGSI